MSAPSIKIFAQVGNNPLALLGGTEAEPGDTEVSVLRSASELMHTLGDMFAAHAAQVEFDLKEIEEL